MNIFLLLVYVLFSMSQPRAESVDLPGIAIWLEPARAGLAILLDNGEVYLFDGELKNLAQDWQGDNLLACKGNILGVNSEGRLAIAGKESNGPLIAAYSRPLCTEEGVFALAKGGSQLYKLSPDLDIVKTIAISALPDAELLAFNWLGQASIALLTDPSERYNHGVLGDAIEATGLSIISQANLGVLASYTLEAPYVFEQRRVLAFDIGDAEGLLATRSSPAEGAGVVLLGPKNNELALLATARPIGRGNRWLNLFASHESAAYAIRTPHIGGPLQRYTLVNGKLQIEDFDLGLTNHVLGQRNLDLAKFTPEGLIAPSQDRQNLYSVTCLNYCIKEYKLSLMASLTSNTTRFHLAGRWYIAAADAQKRLHLWHWPAGE